MRKGGYTEARILSILRRSKGEVPVTELRREDGMHGLRILRGNALAVFPIDGEERGFANPVSASGARQVSGAYAWWARVDTTTPENGMGEGSRQNCHSQNTGHGGWAHHTRTTRCD